MKYIITLIIGLSLGLYLAEYTQVWGMTCDYTKYSGMYINSKELGEAWDQKEGFLCKGSKEAMIRMRNHEFLVKFYWLKISSVVSNK